MPGLTGPDSTHRATVVVARACRVHGSALIPGFVALGGSLDALRVVLAVEAASEFEVRATLADDP